MQNHRSSETCKIQDKCMQACGHMMYANDPQWDLRIQSGHVLGTQQTYGQALCLSKKVWLTRTVRGHLMHIIQDHVTLTSSAADARLRIPLAQEGADERLRLERSTIVYIDRIEKVRRDTATQPQHCNSQLVCREAWRHDHHVGIARHHPFPPRQLGVSSGASRAHGLG